MIGLAPFALVALLQTLPLSVNLCVDPDATGAVMGYNVSLDGAPATDAGMPPVVTCKTFVGGATSPGIEFTVSVTLAGNHTVTISGYNLTGTSPAASLTFPIGPAPGKPANPRVAK